MSAEGSHSRPKIFMTGDAVGGVWQYSLLLISHLTARGSQVLLATLGPEPSPVQRAEAALIPDLKLVSAPYPLEWMPGAAASFDSSSEWLLKTAAAFAPDIVHLNGFAHATLPWGVPAIIVAHSCVASWWRAVHNTSLPAEWSWYVHAVTAGLRSAAAVTAPSSAMADALAREYKFDRGSIQVIPNFTDVAHQLRTDKLHVCLAAGRFWDEAKNLPILTTVAPRVDWPILLAGSSDNSPTGTDLQLLGALPHAELIGQMRRASIFLHPALYEPFGLAVLEAARGGCCLILADIPSLRELWDGCAEFVDPRNAEHWVLEINRLIADPTDRRRLAEQARRRSERFRPEPAIAAYHELYSRVLALENAGAVA